MDKSRYRIAHIPKRSGGTRTLEIPDAALMAEQRKILRWLSARRLAALSYADGFVHRRSIATNAQAHVGKRVVLRIDIRRLACAKPSRRSVRGASPAWTLPSISAY